VADLLGLADAGVVDAFIVALTSGDVLAGIHLLDALEAEGRDLVAFSEQLVTRLREVLVERLTGPASARAEARSLADAARRLTGLDASRSGLGGYRWQLELCLLAAADAAPRVSVDAAQTLAPVPPPAATRDAPPAERRAAQAPDRPPATQDAAAQSAGPATGAPAVSDPGGLEAIRTAWPRIVAAIGDNPANRPLVSTCRPVEIRDGILVLGFPEDQAFMRDIAERKRRVLEDGIAAVIGRPVAVRCVVTNLAIGDPVEPGEDDLVAQARRIFDGELAGIEDID
jgi:hypothetical protein